jgi:DNA polymerase (family 10)
LDGVLPKKLVTDKDLRGILHYHTDASNRTEAFETMAKATRQRGFEYFGVADHSKFAHYVGGLSVEAIAQQHREAHQTARDATTGAPKPLGVRGARMADTIGVAKGA